MEPDYIDTIFIRDEECPYDPENNIAKILCDSCSEYNEVECYIEAGEPVFQGFVCTKCGAWNAPE